MKVLKAPGYGAGQTRPANSRTAGLTACLESPLNWPRQDPLKKVLYVLVTRVDTASLALVTPAIPHTLGSVLRDNSTSLWLNPYLARSTPTPESPGLIGPSPPARCSGTPPGVPIIGPLLGL